MNTEYYGTRIIALERVHYFPRQLITAKDMTDEQRFLLEKLRRHNRYLHGWGVVCGCEVKAAPTAERPWQVTVCPGYLLTPQGDEIEIPRAVEFDLAGNWRQAFDPCSQPPPCPPAGPPPAGEERVTIYLAVCYTECNSRPVRIHPAGCACDEAACEYSRIRESYELVRLMELPESHQMAQKADQDWYNKYQKWVKDGVKSPRPVFSCSEYPDDNCVVLASIALPKETNTQIVTSDIK